MKSDDIDVLQALVTAANDWRATGLTANVEVNIITTEINNETVILSWNTDTNNWDIRTQ